MTITLNALQKQRRDTASNWTSNNTVLLAGELGYESDTKKFKIGDGSTAWQSLDYIPIPDTNRLLTGNLTVGGNFTVNGTTTTIDTTTLTVEDKNIEIGKVSTPTDTTADGGGITLKGATDKTFNWVNSTDSWTLSEHLDLANGKVFKINNTEILSATTLGSSVVSSSLTSVGTITTGTWNATAISGSKVTPDFGSQNIITTGGLTVDTTTFHVDSSNNRVGIGTTSPISKLNIVDGSDNDAILFVQGADTTSEYVSLGVQTGKAIVRGGGSGSTNTALAFEYSNAGTETEGMRINSSGFIGIGTTSPTEKLDVAGSIRCNTGTDISMDSSASGQVRFRGNGYTGAIALNNDAMHIYSNASSRDLVFGVHSSEKMRIDTSGRVGINGSGVNGMLEVRASGGGGNTQLTAVFGANEGTTAGTLTNNNDKAARIGFNHYSTSEEPFCFVSAGSGSSSNGMNLGGGTSAMNAATLIKFFTAANTTTTTGTERMRIDSSGNVGIATTSGGGKLAILSNSSTYEGLELQTPSGDGSGEFHIGVHQSGTTFGRAIVFKRGGADGMDTESMRIDSSGNVMIGATSSSGKLHVEHSGELNSYFVGNTSTSGSRIILQNKNTAANSFTGVLGADAGGQTTASINFYSADNDNNEGYLTLETRPSGGTPAERMRIDSSGNVGIGTTSPLLGAKLTVASQGLAITGQNLAHSANSLRIGEEGSGLAQFRAYGPDTSTDGSFQFTTSRSDGTGGGERMRIDSSGRFLVGKTSNGVGQVGAELRSGNTDYAVVATSTGHTALIVNRLSSTGELVQFRQANTAVGHISVTSSSTSYNTSSDYRLKENAVAISDGITRLKTLKPYKFNFKTDTSKTVDGFFAHEVTAVPEAITGTKDEVDADNNPVYQGIDQSKLVPLLTAALQEAIAKIEVLETKVAALEAA